jgi:CheY-like chemotaxis protein
MVHSVLLVAELLQIATDGNDINRSEPDVVLMDIEMPGLNGIEITERFVRDSLT